MPQINLSYDKNKAAGKLGRLYKGQTPVKGAFLYKTTNCTDGHYQIYPAIYTLNLSDYKSTGGASSRFYDNIIIRLDNENQSYSANCYYGIFCSDNNAYCITLEIPSVTFKLEHKNSNNPIQTYSSLPVDVWVSVSTRAVGAYSVAIENWRNDFSYGIDGISTINIWYCIPSGTTIGSSIRIYPTNNQIYQVVHKWSKMQYRNLDYSNANYMVTDLSHGGISGEGILLYGLRQSNNGYSVYPYALSFNTVSRTRPTNFWQDLNHSSLSAFKQSLDNMQVPGLGTGTFHSPNYSINYSSQYSETSGTSKSIYFVSTNSIDRAGNKPINYVDTNINARTDKQLFGITYATAGNWYTALNGGSVATEATNGAYFRASSYSFFNTYSNQTDSTNAKVVITNNALVPTSQTLITYINSYKYLQLPANNSYSSIISPTSVNSAYYSLGYFFSGYLSTAAASNTYIDSEKYKGSYIFDWDQSNYVTRFNFSLGNKIGWTTQRFIEEYGWINSNSSRTFVLRRSNNWNTSIEWFYMFAVPKGEAVKVNGTTVTSTSNYGNPSDTSWHGSYDWGAAVTGREYYPSVGSRYSVQFNTYNNGNGWQISFTLYDSSILSNLYTSGINFTVTQHTSVLYGEDRYLQISGSGTLLDQNNIPSPTGLNQVYEADVYVMFKILGPRSNKRDQDVWCTRLLSTRTGGSWAVKTSAVTKYKYKYIQQ